MRQATPDLRQKLLVMAQAGRAGAFEDLDHHMRLREAAFQVSSVAEIILTDDDTIALVNPQAISMFGLSRNDVGRPFRDLELSYRPVELRSEIEQARQQRRPFVLEAVKWWDSRTEGAKYLDIRVAALADEDGAVAGVKLDFRDVTQQQAVRDELEAARRNLQAAYEELESSNEELESTNEELQSTVEELETTNEEFQSSNEELETMNEEMQATNEELHTLNTELAMRTEESNKANAFLHAILTGLSGALVVVNRDFAVLEWNTGAQDMWGLRPEEARGKNLMALEIGLQVHELSRPLRRCMDGGRSVERVTLTATNRTGKRFECNIICTPLDHPDGPTGAILVMSAGPEVHGG